MKKILYILPIIVLFSLQAVNTNQIEIIPQEKTIQELTNLALEHLDKATDYKLKWYDYEKALHADKYDILKKHLKEKMDLKKKLLTKLDKDEDIQSYLANSIEQMKELKKKQHLEWKALEDKWHEKAESQAEAQAIQMGIEIEETHESESEEME